MKKVLKNGLKCFCITKKRPICCERAAFSEHKLISVLSVFTLDIILYKEAMTCSLLSCSISPGNVMTPLWRESAAHNPDAEAAIREGETWQVGPCPGESWVIKQTDWLTCRCGGATETSRSCFISIVNMSQWPRCHGNGSSQRGALQRRCC